MHTTNIYLPNGELFKGLGFVCEKINKLKAMNISTGQSYVQGNG